MATLWQVLAGIVSTIAIIGAIIAVVVFVKGSYGKARMEALREDNIDLRNRADDMAKSLASCKTREDALEIKIEALESENKMLHEMVTQRADVSTLIERQGQQHAEIMGALAAIIAQRGKPE